MRTKRIGDIEISAIAEFAGPYRDPLEMFPLELTRIDWGEED